MFKRSHFAAVAAIILLTVSSLSAQAMSVSVSSPTNGASVTSPVHFAATANSRRTITGWNIYVDGNSVYRAGQVSSISTDVAMSSGTHQVLVRAWNSTGRYASASLSITVQTAGSVGVAISPTSATLQTGLSQQFNASVTGTTNTAVSWLVNGVQGGTATTGTISSTGLYKAPATVPTGGTVTVAARSQADSTKSANATVTIAAAPATVKVSMSPLNPTLQTGATQQFTATVSGTTNTAVAWLVNGVQGGNTTVGTISSTGLYSAPPTVPSGMVTVTARSSYDSTASASTNVSVIAASTPVAVSVSPTSATLQTGTTKQFTASVTGTTNTSVTWLVNGVQGGNSTTGTVSSAGLYTAPSTIPSAAVTVTAKSTYDTSKTANATVSITAGNVNQYYISTSGSDSNNGTSPQTAWATINHANSALTLGAGGATVHVAPGTYSGSIYTTKNGTATARIVYISDVRYGAVLKGSSGGSIWQANGSYTDIVGFDFDGSSNPGLMNGISTDNGSTAVGTNHVRILNNKLHDIGGACNTTGNAVILLNADDGNSAYANGYNLVDGNLLYHNNCGAAGSTATNNGQHGIYSVIAYDTIRNNVIVDQGGGQGITSWHRVSHWTVTNNTVVGTNNGGIMVGNDSSTGVHQDYLTLTNNIVVNTGNTSTSLGGITFHDCGVSPVVQNNLMYGNKLGNYYGSTCGSESNTKSGSNSTTFVNYTGTGAGDYRSVAGSAAIDGGTTACSSGMSPCVPTVDFNGGSRPQGAAIDIGAHESGSVYPSWGWQY